MTATASNFLSRWASAVRENFRTAWFSASGHSKRSASSSAETADIPATHVGELVKADDFEADLESQLGRAGPWRKLGSRLADFISSTVGLWLLTLALVICYTWATEAWFHGALLYDEKVSTGISDVIRKYDAWSEKINFIENQPEWPKSISPDAMKSLTYASNIGFYSELKADISSIKLRVMATPHSPVEPAWLDELTELIDQLRERHAAQGNIVPGDFLAIYKNLIDAYGEILLQFELKLKAGDEDLKQTQERLKSIQDHIKQLICYVVRLNLLNCDPV
jgi:hypothetical protein